MIHNNCPTEHTKRHGKEFSAFKFRVIPRISWARSDHFSIFLWLFRFCGPIFSPPNRQLVARPSAEWNATEMKLAIIWSQKRKDSELGYTRNSKNDYE
jgi:hypothetical protein